MGTCPMRSECFSSVEREVRAGVGWVEQFRGWLGRMLGNEDYRRAGCCVAKLLRRSEIRWGETAGFYSEAYVD
jgi:hypothetical protein